MLLVVTVAAYACMLGVHGLSSTMAAAMAPTLLRMQHVSCGAGAGGAAVCGGTAACVRSRRGHGRLLSLLLANDRHEQRRTCDVCMSRAPVQIWWDRAW
jgi:hypothetical protein